MSGDAITRVRERMQSQGVEAALISAIDNVRWLSGFTGSFGYVVLTPNRGVFISDSRYAEQAREQVTGLDVRIFQSPQTAAATLSEVAKDLGLSKLSFEAEHVTFATHKSLADKLNGVVLEPVAELIHPLRLVKSPDEIEKIRKACALADACFEHVKRMLQPGVTEFDIALDIEFYFRRQGAQLAFPAHVVSGERSSRPHGDPSDKKLEKGDFVTLDFGAQVEGYCSDITRTVVIGEASERQKEIYFAVLEAQLASLDAMKPGVSASDVDKTSRDVLEKVGLAKYFGHGLGHGLGRVVHDGGRLGPGSTDILEPGQVWTVEPGVYIEGFGGVRIEDDVVVTHGGVEILTKTTKELLVL